MPLLEHKKRRRDALEHTAPDPETKSRRLNPRASSPAVKLSSSAKSNLSERQYDISTAALDEPPSRRVRQRTNSPDRDPITRSDESTSTARTTSPSASEASALNSTENTPSSSETSSGTDSELDTDDDLLSSSGEDDSDESVGKSSVCDFRSLSPIPILSLRKKPKIGSLRSIPDSDSPAHECDGGSALAARLKFFLPSLAAANAQLEQERAAGRLAERDIEKLDHVIADGKEADEESNGGERQYIEMNLGLGVLEEQDPDACSSDSDEQDERSEEDGYNAGSDEPLDKARWCSKGSERDFMGKLMGQKRAISKAHIEELA